MARDLYFGVAGYHSCPVQFTISGHLKKVQLFPATEPLEILLVNILGPLSKAKSGIQLQVVLTDGFTKLTRSISVFQLASISPTTVLVYNEVIPCGVPINLLTNNGQQFVSQFFAIAPVRLFIEHFTTTAYHSQTNGRVERFNLAVVAHLRHYIGDHKKYWDQYV